jgi:hypothetical protein
MKTCKKEGCENPRFGGGYCKWHQHLRPDYTFAMAKAKQVKTIKPLKRTPIKKKVKVSGEGELFKQIEKELRAKDPDGLLRSQVSGTVIHLPEPANFSHILPKGSYPGYRLYKPNIYVVTKLEHFLWHNRPWTLETKIGWTAKFRLRDKLRLQYHEERK